MVMLSGKKTQRTMAGLCSLPDELIISEILHRLPVSSLVRFKCINKHWLKKISDPIFANSHLACQTPGRVKTTNYRIFRFSDAKEVYDVNLASVVNERFLYLRNSTSNGLLLVVTDDPRDKKLYMVNPVVRRYMKLPSTPLMRDLTFLHLDDTLNKNRYRVVAWIPHRFDQKICLLVIQNHMNNVWQEFSPPKGLALMGHLPAVFNGWFYWVTRGDLGSLFDEKWGILAFNPEIGEFREIRMPNREKGSTVKCGYRLFTDKEYLYLVQNCWDTRVGMRILFYLVTRYKDDLEEPPIPINNIYNGEVQHLTDNDQDPWEFRFACTSLEAQKIIHRYRSFSDFETDHINSLVWEFSC